MFAKLKNIRVKLPKRLQLGLNQEQREEGVTLIELLAVVVILGIISAIAVPAVSSAINNAKVTATLNDEGTLQIALQRYYNQYDIYPTSLSILLTSSKTVDGQTHGPYVTNTFPENDGFGNPIYYAQVDGGTGYILLSGDGQVLTPTSGKLTIGSSSYIYAAGGADSKGSIASVPTTAALSGEISTAASAATFTDN